MGVSSLFFCASGLLCMSTFPSLLRTVGDNCIKNSRLVTTWAMDRTSWPSTDLSSDCGSVCPRDYFIHCFSGTARSERVEDAFEQGVAQMRTYASINVFRRARA